MVRWLPFGKKNRTRQRVTIVNVTDDDFEIHVLRRSFKKPVMVDFWASWCAPCRRLGPMLEKMADEADSPFVLAKINTEDNQKIPGRFQIRSIPAVKMFRNGQVVGEFTGVLSEPTVREFIAQKTSGPPPAVQRRKKKKKETPAGRLATAENHLKRGRGFQAYLLLRDFPADNGAEEAATAAALFPLAKFMVDMEDGDGWTGDKTVDGLHLDALDALEARDPAGALENLYAAREALNEGDDVPTEAVIASLLTLFPQLK
jgi:thioredoxin